MRIYFLIYCKAVFHFEEPGKFFIFMSSDEDLIFSGKSAMDIRNDFQKKKKKKHLERIKHS